MITFEKVIIFIVKEFVQFVHVNKFNFNKFHSISDDHPTEGLHLYKWPYIHGPQEHDQLSNIITSM